MQGRKLYEEIRYLFDLWQRHRSSKCINWMQWMCDMQQKNVAALESSYNFLFVLIVCLFVPYLALTVLPVLYSYLFDLWQQDWSGKCMNRMQWMWENKRMSQHWSHPTISCLFVCFPRCLT